MSVRVRLTEAAQEEHKEALGFYRQRGVHLAKAFNREFKRELALIKERPYAGALYREGTRRRVFPKFPYSFIHFVEDDLITIYGVEHHSRDPLHWIERVKDRR